MRLSAPLRRICVDPNRKVWSSRRNSWRMTSSIYSTTWMIGSNQKRWVFANTIAYLKGKLIIDIFLFSICSQASRLSICWMMCTSSMIPLELSWWLALGTTRCSCCWCPLLLPLLLATVWSSSQVKLLAIVLSS